MRGRPRREEDIYSGNGKVANGGKTGGARRKTNKEVTGASTNVCLTEERERENISAQKRGIKSPIEHVDTLRSFQRKMDEAVSTVSSKIRLRYVSYVSGSYRSRKNPLSRFRYKLDKT